MPPCYGASFSSILRLDDLFWLFEVGFLSTVRSKCFIFNSFVQIQIYHSHDGFGRTIDFWYSWSRNERFIVFSLI